MADNPVSRSSVWSRDDRFDALSGQISDLSNYILGNKTKFGSGVPRDPVDIARGEIADLYNVRGQTKKALPEIWQSYLNRVRRNDLGPDEAASAYLDLARASGGDLKQAYQKSEKLRREPAGFTPTERYDRYKPALSLATEQLLGRKLSDQEFKNYVSAFQGMGISNPQDVSSAFGEMLLSSPEYKSQAVIFDPSKVSKGLATMGIQREVPSMDKFASMLNAY